MDDDGDDAALMLEIRRLALVRRLGLLDTPPDERFDVFTRLAASVTESPVSTISLIDEQRVWFKSSQGLPDGVGEVPRDIAACAHVLNTNERVLIIPDATKDPRVCTSPLVTGPFGMRFYAGVPLRAPGGEVLGSLCIIDRVPREPDERTINSLIDLANGVSSALRIHEMSELVLKDALTGLGNRRLFDETVASAFAVQHDSYAPHAVGLILLDLDRFKACNEMLGHGGGDAVLREVAQRILSSIRVTDVAARLGGDEFAIIVTLPDHPDVEDDFRDIAERVLLGIRSTPVTIEAQRLRIEASLGVAIASSLAGDTLSASPVDLMRAADVALYKAKRDGRNRVATARGSSRIGGIGSKHTLQQDLRVAITEGGRQLSLVLQPLRCAHDAGTILGFEALVRWAHPTYGPISPGDFVPVAERSGLAQALDTWVLGEACRAAMRFPEPRPSISVNITPSFLIAPDFLATVDAALAASGLPPERLCIEVTERVFLNDLDVAREATDALIHRGVQVALDDFGAGHASFGFLTNVALTKVKLDGSMVSALQQGPVVSARATAVLRGIISMAHDLGLIVVAEGVETADQMQILQAFGADEIQGWHTGRPAAPEFWLVQADAALREASAA